MLTVAQMVEHLIVIQKGVSSILICQPKGETEQVASPTDCKSAVWDCVGSTPTLPTKKSEKSEEKTWHFIGVLI